MGCNSSKGRDIENSKRQRVPNAPNPQSQSTTNTSPLGTPARGIPGAAIPGGGERNIAQSYSENRMGEQDLFKDIVDRAAQNFIDVTYTPAPLEDKDALDRIRTYTAQMANSQLLQSSIFALPMAAVSNGFAGGVNAVLSVQPLDPRDFRLVTTCSQVCSAAMQSMRVQDVGDIVVCL
eukprot:gnl/Hemi2/19574_TR6503_c0_g1_i1.p1 gnl/Hemi2/19574_TR6503_c0_g1~~gnl/Hemi2/19574_TR6503_c0_g1_i1.p1  ORF type:complete len:178 (-),score=22.65 gnl/Hemi2/19574_TR6503_c0_g1_i1:102-635(-)